MSKKLVIAVLMLLLATAAFGQNVSSSVKGVVVDPSGAVVPKATLTLTNQATATSFTSTSDEAGAFTFLNVLSGTYDLKLEASGFQPKVLKGVVVEASQIRTLGELKLDVGGGTQEVVVKAEVAAIQLASAEKSGTVTGDQLEHLAIKGRDVFALLSTIPGVVDTGTAGTRDMATPTAIAGTTINGGRDSSKNFTVDGITNMDTGSNQTVHFTPSPDAVAEVRVLTSNYQAEFGRSSSGTISVITKNGTRDFHGTAYNYYRHESLNANSWNNNRNKTAKQPYRLRNTGYTLGGPIFIPNHFNTEKNKLFFFWSQEFSAKKQDFVAYATTPTQAERNGDFSQSLDSNGKLIVIKNPVTGVAFTNNQIPSSMITAAGQKLLNFFPLPNYVSPNPTNRANYRTTYSGDYSRRSDMMRVDANITDKMSAYFRFNHDSDEQLAPWGNWITSMNWMPSPVTYNQPGYGFSAHVTNVFSPTLINELNVGKSHNKLSADVTDAAAWARDKVGVGEWFKDADLVPNIAFGSGRYNPIRVNVIGQFPYVNYNDIYSVTDSISKTYKNHTFRAGVYFERTGKLSPVWNSYRGSLSFGRTTLNPQDSNDGFANALLGTVTSYSESSKKLMGDWWFNNVEWFFQDNWRVNRRLTLDIGLRMYHMSPVTDQNNTMATFDPSAYNTANAPRLYRPAINPANGRRMGYDATTNTWVEPVLIGFLVPGSGDLNNGGRAAGVDGYPEGLATNPAIEFGPRVGFALDVFGNGKTAVRGGFGVFKDRGSILPNVYAAGGPPVAFNSVAYYTTLNQLSQAAGYRSPSGGDWTPGGTALYGDTKTPTTMNFSLGIQQQLPKSVVLDVAYVGSLSRHLWVNRYINTIPIGARFNPSNVDASNGAVLPDNFLRQYTGWTDVHRQEFSGTSNYNSLQVSATRKFTNGLQFGASYTWAKALGVQSDENGSISAYMNPRTWNYGPLGQDRAHTLVINYYYDLPKLGKLLNFRPVGWVTDNWSISGINTFQTGAPVTPNIYWTDYRDVTGSSEGARGLVVGDPYANIPAGMNFNPAAFAPVPKGTYGNVNFGNMMPGMLRGPGINNWDFTITKRVPLGKSETRYVQFRAEMFNVFNHTQYSAYDTNVGFNAAGVQVNPTVGQYTTARAPRQMQLSLKLFF